MAATHDKERQLTREIAPKVEGAIPGAEVLTVELAGPDRFTVYIDHAQGVDHALCERATNVLRDYLREYSVEVSSPGLARPLRTAEHFRRVIGRNVALKTGAEIAGRKNFKGELKDAGERAVTVGVGGNEVHIPYDAIVRGNLIDEG
ncbi:MAG: ribosome maturation factor RimP [Actinobacteria bacterium]|nr:MAG: ribosome maturation factor RimP [Actinomycetota bacterium]